MLMIKVINVAGSLLLLNYFIKSTNWTRVAIIAACCLQLTLYPLLPHSGQSGYINQEPVSDSVLLPATMNS